MQLQDISIRTASLATLKPVSATIAEEIPSRFVSPARWLWVPSDTLDGKVPGIYGCSSPQYPSTCHSLTHPHMSTFWDSMVHISESPSFFGFIVVHLPNKIENTRVFFVYGHIHDILETAKLPLSHIPICLMWMFPKNVQTLGNRA
jgi:hypothetical protein